VSVSVLVFVSGWRSACAFLVERFAFRAPRLPLAAARAPLAAHGHEHGHEHEHERHPAAVPLSEFPGAPRSLAESRGGPGGRVCGPPPRGGVRAIESAHGQGFSTVRYQGAGLRHCPQRSATIQVPELSMPEKLLLSLDFSVDRSTDVPEAISPL
jgi:hypothetical protein